MSSILTRLWRWRDPSGTTQRRWERRDDRDGLCGSVPVAVIGRNDQAAFCVYRNSIEVGICRTCAGGACERSRGEGRGGVDDVIVMCAVIRKGVMLTVTALILKLYLPVNLTIIAL